MPIVYTRTLVSFYFCLNSGHAKPLFWIQGNAVPALSPAHSAGAMFPSILQTSEQTHT